MSLRESIERIYGERRTVHLVDQRVMPLGDEICAQGYKSLYIYIYIYICYIRNLRPRYPKEAREEGRGEGGGGRG